MNRNIKDRLYIATVCAEHREIMDNYDIGVELDQCCQAERMDAPLKEETCAEIEELLELVQSTSSCDAKTQILGSMQASGEKRNCILHAPFSEIFPAAIDPLARKLAMQRLQQAAGFALKYGAEKMVVHSGWVPLIYFKEWQEDRAVEFWEEFGESDKLKKENRQTGALKIVIENVMDDEPYMLAKMMERIKNPNIRLCLDVGHAACVGSTPADEWLEVMAPYLEHLHIHNNDGTHDWHKPVFDGIVDMEKFLDKAIELCTPDTTFTIESLEGLSSMQWLKTCGYLG